MKKFRLQRTETTTIEKIYEVEAENEELARRKLDLGGDFRVVKEFNELTDYSYPKVV